MSGDILSVNGGNYSLCAAGAFNMHFQHNFCSQSLKFLLHETNLSSPDPVNYKLFYNFCISKSTKDVFLR